MKKKLAVGFGSFFTKVKESANKLAETENYKAAKEKMETNSAKM